MGVFRKTTSVFTLGAVDFLSDKERIARSSRLTKQEARKQTRLLRDNNRLLEAQLLATQLEIAEPHPQPVEAREKPSWKWWNY